MTPTKKPTVAPTPNPTVPPGTPTTSPTDAPIASPSFTHAIFTSLAISDDIPEANYAQVGETLASVTNGIIMRKMGFDVEEAQDSDDGSARRLVTLEHDSTSFSLVPMSILDQRQEDVGFAWVAYRMSYNVRQFDGLGKNELKETIDEGWTQSIEDGTLLWDLQSKDPNVLGAAVFGQESATDIRDPEYQPPTSPPTRDDTVGTRGEGNGAGVTPWWVWLLVGLVGLAIAVALVFFVLAKRRTKKVRRQVSQKGELMQGADTDSDEVPITQNATFEESSDEGQHPNQAFAPDQTFDATFPAFEVPDDEGKGILSSSCKDNQAGREWGGDGFSMNDLAKQPGW